MDYYIPYGATVKLDLKPRGSFKCFNVISKKFEVHYAESENNDTPLERLEGNI